PCEKRFARRRQESHSAGIRPRAGPESGSMGAYRGCNPRYGAVAGGSAAGSACSQALAGCRRPARANPRDGLRCRGYAAGAARQGEVAMSAAHKRIDLDASRPPYEIVAHRGDTAECTENTIAAFLCAAEMG